MNSNSNLVKIREEVKTIVSDKETMNALLQSTFNKMTPEVAKQAMLEAMLRGFTFDNLLQKDVYAIPFGGSYSLVTSIDYARKIGMRSGVIGVSKPKYSYKENGAIDSCEITVFRLIGNTKGEFTSEVYFDEYNTGKNQWSTKPRTMIAKVAEMHALRKACPEESSKMYIEDEIHEVIKEEVSFTKEEEKLKQSKTEEELKQNWISLPVEAKKKLENVKNEVKNSFNKKEESEVVKAMKKGLEKAKEEQESKEELKQLAEQVEGKIIE